LDKQLDKFDAVFQGSILSTEGVFRENASITTVQKTAENLAVGNDTLDDFDDPITTSHALKNLLVHYIIIPKSQQIKLITTTSGKLSEQIKIRNILNSITE